MTSRPGAVDGGPLAELVVRDHPAGCTVAVRARPGARRAELVGLRRGSLLISVTVAAERGRANAAVIELLAAALGIAKGKIELVGGSSHRQKVLRVEGVSTSELRQRLAECLGEEARGS